MSEGNFENNDQLQEPPGADAFALETLREKILHKIEDVQDAATLRKVDRFLYELAIGKVQSSAYENKEADDLVKADDVFAKAVEKYHTLLQKLAQ